MSVTLEPHAYHALSSIWTLTFEHEDTHHEMWGTVGLEPAGDNVSLMGTLRSHHEVTTVASYIGDERDSGLPAGNDSLDRAAEAAFDAARDEIEDRFRCLWERRLWDMTDAGSDASHNRRLLVAWGCSRPCLVLLERDADGDMDGTILDARAFEEAAEHITVSAHVVSSDIERFESQDIVTCVGTAV